MGYHVESSTCMFRSVRYNFKTTAELREAMTRKVVEIEGNITEREARLERPREDFQIDAERLAQLVIRYQRDDNSNFTSYNNQGDPQGRVVPAGVIANIIHEREMIDSERDQIRKMELILRNIRETEPYVEPRSGEHRTRPCIHQLTDDELEYLGF